MTTHRFNESLEASAQAAAAPWWENVYRQAFPSFQGMSLVVDDGAGQRNGVDRTITLGSGRVVTVDEKVRQRDWPDFFIEFYSDRDRRVAGWIAKDLACDYIAYAFVASGCCYLLPFRELRAAWRTHRQAWVGEYGRLEVENQGYVTVGCPVPRQVVLAAIAEHMLLRFEPVEVPETADADYDWRDDLPDRDGRWPDGTAVNGTREKGTA